MPDLLIVDVRDPNLYAQGQIQGARNIPAKSVATAGLPINSHIVVYCGEASCPFSSQAAADLIAAGYTNTQLLEGGLAEWIKRGYPIQTGTPASPQPEIQRTRLKDARTSLKGGTAVPVDVRPKAEFVAGYLPNAKSAPLEELANHFIDLPKDVVST